MKTKRLIAALLGSAMVLTFAGAAFAVTNNTALTQTGTALDPADFDDEPEACEGLDLDPGTVLWHFVFTDNQDGISGHFFWSTGEQTLVSEDQGNIQAWNIITDDDVTLDGSQTHTDGTGAQFNLSHTCLAAPEATPTPTLPPTSTIDQPATAGTSMNLVLGLILLIAGGLTAYAMRPRHSER